MTLPGIRAWPQERRRAWQDSNPQRNHVGDMTKGTRLSHQSPMLYALSVTPKTPEPTRLFIALRPLTLAALDNNGARLDTSRLGLLLSLKGQRRPQESDPCARLRRKGNATRRAKPFAPKAPARPIRDAMRNSSLDSLKITMPGKLSRVAMPASRLFIFTTPEHAHLAIRRHDRPWLLVTAPHAQVHDLIAPSIMPFPHFGAQHRPFLADLPAR